MKQARILALLALAATPLSAQGGESFQIRAKELLLGDGTSIANGVVVVEAGRIRRVGTDVDASLPMIEHDGVLSSGMIACHSHSGAGGEVYDETRSLMPEARLVHAFNPKHSDFEKARKAGVTTLVLAPSAQNVAGGITAVVKSAGGKIVKKEAHLSLSFSHDSLVGGPQGFFFFFNADEDARAEAEGRKQVGPRKEAQPLRADGGPESTSSSSRGSRFPTSYGGALRALRMAFASPEGVAAKAASGEMPVLIEAWDRNEVVRAVGFARQQKLRGALRGAPFAFELVELLKSSGMGVIVGPYRTGHFQRSLESVKALSEAGVPLAFALGGAGTNPHGLRMSAALAIGAGADPKAVWRGLTSDAASIAGVDDRVGNLEAGKDADFVLWSGHPLNLSSRVEAVYVDGVRVSGGAR